MLTEVEIATQATGQILDKHAFELGLRFARFDTLPLQRLHRKLHNLLAYRSDAHIAVWMALEVNGYVWDAFTLLWRGDAHTLSGLAEQLGPRRHYGISVYAAALRELVRRAWAQESNGSIQLTSIGKQVRRAAENCTDEYFYLPWMALGERRTHELRDLLHQLVAALRPLEVSSG